MGMRFKFEDTLYIINILINILFLIYSFRKIDTTTLLRGELISFFFSNMPMNKFLLIIILFFNTFKNYGERTNRHNM